MRFRFVIDVNHFKKKNYTRMRIKLKKYLCLVSHTEKGKPLGKRSTADTSNETKGYLNHSMVIASTQLATAGILESIRGQFH